VSLNSPTSNSPYPHPAEPVTRTYSWQIEHPWEQEHHLEIKRSTGSGVAPLFPAQWARY
jgi:hypothetical protein